MRLTRRQLATATAVSLCGITGCAMGSVPDIEIRNATDAEQTGGVTVTRLSDDERLLDETFILAAGDIGDDDTETVYADVVGTETARVRVTVRDGPNGTHDFADDEAGAMGLDVEIRADEINFSEEIA